MNSVSFDIYIEADTESYLTLTENSSLNIQPNITYSKDSSTSIIYSIANYNAIIAPSWVAINSSTALLTIRTPNVTSAASSSFYIKALVAGTVNPILKQINVQSQQVICFQLQKVKCCRLYELSRSSHLRQRSYPDHPERAM